MQSLLIKVQQLETEAQTIINRAKESGTAQVTKLLAREDDLLRDVQKHAQQRGEAIIKETIDATKSELNALHQDETKSIASIHATAEKNRAATIVLVLELFHQAYQS